MLAYFHVNFQLRCPSGLLHGLVYSCSLSSHDRLQIVHYLISDLFMRIYLLFCRPGDVADVFHTFFGICGLSLLGYTEDSEQGYTGLRRVDPVYALPVHTLERMGLPVWHE